MHHVDATAADIAPIVVRARAAKTLGAFWASTADYLPAYVNERGIARLDPPAVDLPPMIFVEDANARATGTAGITIAADDLEADVDALVRVGATRQTVDDAGRRAAMLDPEGNPFTVLEVNRTGART